ncbi:MAG: hypothetical protein LHV69_06630 [Elusimicrobia bacterium]|nr:hypothetical protein [Candidatus Obscuribacterium magneticum]
MDEKGLQAWSEKLDELRGTRQQTVASKVLASGGPPNLEAYPELIKESLVSLMSHWWEIEKAAWKDNPPADTAAGLSQTKKEMDTVIDLELEAIERERANTREFAAFNTAAARQGLEQIENDLRRFGQDLKKSYAIKIDSLARSARRRERELSAGDPSLAPAYGSASSSNGLGLAIMFVVGLILGGGGSVYFWNQNNAAQKKLQEETTKLAMEKKQIIDGMILLQDTYYQLATGKLLNIPDLEKLVKTKQEEFSKKRKAIESSIAKQKEALIKKIPAGDRLDKSLEKLEESRVKQMEEVNKAEEEALIPLRQQQKIHKELMDR